MKFKANKKSIDLIFGVAALEALDNFFPQIEVENGTKMGAGVETAVANYSMGDLSALAKLIHAGSLATKEITLEKANALIDSFDDAEKLEAFGKEVIAFLLNATPVIYRAKLRGMTQVFEEMRKALED